jgi:nitrite reductase/ring-hydroxylating ferredoxin subunit
MGFRSVFPSEITMESQMPSKFMSATWLGVLFVHFLPVVRTMAEDQSDAKSAPKPVALIQNVEANELAFSHDGKTIAAGGYYWVRLYDLTTGQMLCSVPPPEKYSETCKQLVFSPDGLMLAVAFERTLIGGPDSIVLWDVTSDRKLRNPRTLLSRPSGGNDAPSTIYHLSFSPDGKTLIAGTPDGTIHLWETITGKERLHFEGGVAAIFAPDGRRVTCVSHDGRVRHFDAATGKCIGPAKEPSRKNFMYAHSVVFSPDCKWVAVCDECSICLKDLDSGTTTQRMDFEGKWATLLGFTEESNFLAVTTDKTLQFIDTKTGQTSVIKPKKGRSFAALSPDGKFIACSGEDKSLRIGKTVALVNRDTHITQAVETTPENLPIQAELLSRKDSYELDLGGLTPDEASNLIGKCKFPPGPAVDLVFKLRNISNQKITLRDPGSKLKSVHLFGEGAINIRIDAKQTGIGPDSTMPKTEYVSLAPGECYSFLVTKLRGEYDDGRYWVLPGEYSVRALYECVLSPAPKGADDARDGFGYVSLWTATAKLRVVEAKK